ncbi:MAG: hypothetical protein J6Q27_04120 [Clostridia bacterium]|nr:hypothetical protein [Clostridia bacterium]
MENSTDTLFSQDTFLTFILVAVVLFILFAILIDRIIPFIEECEDIKREIARADSEKEYLRWKKKLRRLYLSCIPFIGRFLEK